MLESSHAFSGFSVNDATAAKKFYQEVLGLKVEDGPMGMQIKVDGDTEIFVYEKTDHVPATYTILNFVVQDIDKAVTELTGKGLVFEHYDQMTDESGIARGISHNQGPDIAWFKDPAGNIMSVLQNA
jgi:predicted enzyme related to lactoylglutathione lyase